MVFRGQLVAFRIEAELLNGHTEFPGQGARVATPRPSSSALPSTERGLADAHSAGHRRDGERSRHQLSPLLSDLPYTVGHPGTAYGTGSRKFRVRNRRTSAMILFVRRFQLITFV